MFFGEYEHTVDGKGRLIIPAKFRFPVRFFVTRGRNTCLLIFTEEEWFKQAEKWVSDPFSGDEEAVVSRRIFPKVAELACDKQGRVLIPKKMLSHAGIEKEVFVLGMGNRIEVWDTKKWCEYSGQIESKFEDAAARKFDQHRPGEKDTK